jgi:hypothetical protein
VIAQPLLPNEAAKVVAGKGDYSKAKQGSKFKFNEIIAVLVFIMCHFYHRITIV